MAAGDANTTLKIEIPDDVDICGEDAVPDLPALVSSSELAELDLSGSRKLSLLKARTAPSAALQAAADDALDEFILPPPIVTAPSLPSTPVQVPDFTWKPVPVKIKAEPSPYPSPDPSPPPSPKRRAKEGVSTRLGPLSPGSGVAVEEIKP
eukprot:jgi/Mesen1/5968/ME000301S05094